MAVAPVPSARGATLMSGPGRYRGRRPDGIRPRGNGNPCRVREAPPDRPPAVVLDVDGTLVDSVYQHTIAWQRAFAAHGMAIPAWRLHRHVGMGGDRFVPAVAGDLTERRIGDALRDAHAAAFAELIDEVVPLPGAAALLRELAARGHETVLASSAEQDEVERYVDMLEARDLLAGWTTAADVGSTKPSPQIIDVALDIVGRRDGAVMVGDATWDCVAAARAGIRAIAVATGGFGRLELLEAGAVDVLERLEDLPDRIAGSGPSIT